MAKIATDYELAALVTHIVEQAPDGDDHRYRMFLETMAEAVGAYHAVMIGAVMPPLDDTLGWTVSLDPTEDTASTDSPFETIDPDVPMADWLLSDRASPAETATPGTMGERNKPNQEQGTATATV
jgi:hypothetical protein